MDFPVLFCIISFMAELSYLSWERGPAIIGAFREEGVTKAFFIPVGGSD